MTRSLKRRLLWILLGLILFTWVSSTVVTGFYASRVLLAQVDRQLEQYADLVNYITQVFERQLDQGLPVGEPRLTEDFLRSNNQPIVIDNSSASGASPALNIWLDEQLLAVLEDSPRFERPDQTGFSFRFPHGEHSHWRLLTRRDHSSGLWTVVGIDLDQARWSLLGSLARVLFPLLIILPLTLVVLYFGVERGLLPLKSLASQISRRNPQLLDPIETDAVPVELAPVVAALNDLLERLASALESEQRFTANAAHELTTPLAAIKTEVQLCQRLLTEPDGQVMLERIASRVDRAHHSVEQLLTLARLDPDSPLPLTRLSLDGLLLDIVAETAHFAADRSLDVTVKEFQPVEIMGSEEALAILMRNLLVNAFRYASVDSTVCISLTHPGERATLTVSNDCEPLAMEEFRNLPQRFYRVPGSSGVGAGLGLSIVTRVAARHGATFTAGPLAAERGFQAAVTFAAIQASGAWAAPIKPG